MHIQNEQQSMYKSYFKRTIDFIGALTGLLLLSPLFLIVTVGLYFANQGKPFFFQNRPGKNGNLFKIIKFKTMNDKKDTNGNLLSDAIRLTKIGSFVRKTSLDELPQLLNVIKGDMSLVGPRPLLMEYLEHYTPELRRRHHVLPGITGWAQVNGRNTVHWQRRFAFDLWYVDHQSIALDLKILCMTPWKVMKREGVMQPDDPSWGKGKFQDFKGLP